VDEELFLERMRSGSRMSSGGRRTSGGKRKSGWRRTAAGHRGRRARPLACVLADEVLREELERAGEEKAAAAHRGRCAGRAIVWIASNDRLKDKEQLGYVRLGFSCWLGRLGPYRLAKLGFHFFLYVLYVFKNKNRKRERVLG
jgi:hypothetical protein